MRKTINAPCVPVYFPQLRLKVSEKLPNVHWHPQTKNNLIRPPNRWFLSLSCKPRSLACNHAPYLYVRQQNIPHAFFLWCWKNSTAACLLATPITEKANATNVHYLRGMDGLAPTRNAWPLMPSTHPPSSQKHKANNAPVHPFKTQASNAAPAQTSQT